MRFIYEADNNHGWDIWTWLWTWEKRHLIWKCLSSSMLNIQDTFLQRNWQYSVGFGDPVIVYLTPNGDTVSSDYCQLWLLSQKSNDMVNFHKVWIYCRSVFNLIMINEVQRSRRGLGRKIMFVSCMQV